VPVDAASARPHLTLVETPQEPPRPRAQAPAPTPAPSEPTLARSAAERLADATGGNVVENEGGTRTVNFPAPVTQQPYTVTRSLTEPEPATTSSSTTETTPAPAAPTGAGGAPGAPEQSPEDKAREREELYEYFLDRFKRDLLIEREQMGHLIIDNP
jgi:hypothetical protein